MNPNRPPRSTTPAAGSRQEGQAAVEFALVLPLLALLLFGAIQFGTAFWTYQQVSAAASEGARKASVSRTSPTRDADVAAAVDNASPNLDPAKLDVTVTSSWDAGDPVLVKVEYPQTLKVLGITYFDGDLTSERTMRVES